MLDCFLSLSLVLFSRAFHVFRPCSRNASLDDRLVLFRSSSLSNTNGLFLSVLSFVSHHASFPALALLPQVVMKIVKHARENPGEAAEGSLLGLTTETSLEVTNCFPLPLRRDDDTDAHQGEREREREHHVSFLPSFAWL